MGTYDPTTDCFHDSDTMTVNVSIGDEVVCLMGRMKGEHGRLVSHRAGGRVLIRLTQGLYLELPQFCVERYRGRDHDDA